MSKIKADSETAKRNILLNNPCWKESDLSRQCLEENNYNYDSCQLHFDNFKECKKFWNAVKSDRKRRGVSPALPLPEERDKIKADYMLRFQRK